MSASRCGTFLQAREDVEMGEVRHCDAMQLTGVEPDPLPAAKTTIGAATNTAAAVARKSHLRMVPSAARLTRIYRSRRPPALIRMRVSRPGVCRRPAGRSRETSGGRCPVSPCGFAAEPTAATRALRD